MRLSLRNFAILISLSLIFLAVAEAHADLVRTVSTNTADLIGRHGGTPAEDYLGIVTSESPFQINSSQNIDIDVLPLLAPEIGDVIGRDLQNRNSMPRTWSYNLDLPDDASVDSGFFDIVADAEVFFSDANYGRIDFLRFDLILNGNVNNRVRLTGIDGGGSLNMNLTPTGSLPGIIRTAEVEVRAGLFNGNDESFLIHDFQLTASYVSTVPEPSIANLGGAMLLALFGARRRRTID